MIVTTVTVFVKPDHINDFIDATTLNHNNSIKESGNARFDVLQCTDDPTRFLLYEAFHSSEAAAAHKKTEHYLKWRDTVADWMAQPRQGIAHAVICPGDPEQWS